MPHRHRGCKNTNSTKLKGAIHVHIHGSVHVYGGQYYSMNSRSDGKQERKTDACVPKPVGLAGEDAGAYENVVAGRYQYQG